MAIRSAVGDLQAVARAEGAIEQQRLAEQLALHASTEEEVPYRCSRLGRGGRAHAIGRRVGRDAHPPSLTPPTHSASMTACVFEEVV